MIILEGRKLILFLDLNERDFSLFVRKSPDSGLWRRYAGMVKQGGSNFFLLEAEEIEAENDPSFSISLRIKRGLYFLKFGKDYYTLSRRRDRSSIVKKIVRFFVKFFKI